MSRTFFVCALVTLALAEPLVWTGLGNTSIWDDYKNWDQKRIPTASDWVIINTPGATVTLDVAWASVATLQISSGMLIQPNPFAIGNLIVEKDGVYRLDSGTGSLVLTSGNVTSTDGFLFASGFLQGSLTVSTILNFTGAAAKGFNDGNVVVGGSAVCSAGATINFNTTKINFAGGLEIQGGSPVNFVGITTGNQISGGLVLDASSAVQFLVETQFDTIKMGKNSQIQVTKQITQVGTLNMDDSSLVQIAGPNTGLQASSIASTGAINTLSPVAVGSKSQILNLVVDGNAPVTFGDAVAFGTINVKSGSVTFAGASTADTAQFGTASISGVSTLVAGDLKFSGPNVNLANSSISVTGTASFNGQLQVSSGSVSLGNNAKGTVQTFQVIASNGVPVSGTSFNNDGQVTVATQLTFTQLNAAGAGSYALNPSAGLSLNNAVLTAGTVILNKEAVFSGAASAINVGSTNSADNSMIDFTVDGATFHCKQNCPAITSNGVSSSFTASESSS
jgi:hypothetical protein